MKFTKGQLVVCETCGVEFPVKYTGNSNRFCSRKCSQMDVKRREICSKKMAKWNNDNKELITDRMLGDNNPSKNDEVIEKAKSTKRIKGSLHVWKGLRGGNGQTTEPQRLVATMTGWDMEVVINTVPASVENGKRKQWAALHEIPLNYKVDIGNPTLKIAIEIDGRQHKWRKLRQLDIKKEMHLNRLGWKVLRFTNEEVMTNSSQVLLEIQKAVKDL